MLTCFDNPIVNGSSISTSLQSIHNRLIPISIYIIAE